MDNPLWQRTKLPLTFEPERPRPLAPLQSMLGWPAYPHPIQALLRDRLTSLSALRGLTDTSHHRKASYQKGAQGSTELRPANTTNPLAIQEYNLFH